LGDVDVQYVWRFLRRHKIDLVARKSWCESNDPDFTAKAADVVGLYVAPPEKAIVLALTKSPRSRVGACARLGLTIGALQTLAFIAIVFGNQATTYTNRERRHLWSSIVDLLIASTLAVGGIAMTPLPAWVVASTFAAAATFAVVLDLVKVPVLRRLRIP
jgi:hypothetical protein